MVLKIIFLLVPLLLLLGGQVRGDPGGGGTSRPQKGQGSSGGGVRNATSSSGATSFSSASASGSSASSSSSHEEVIMASESAGKTSFARKSDTWFAQQHMRDVPDDGLLAPMPYSFSYDINDYIGNKQYRKETADGTGLVTGSYGYWGPDGIYRHVDYVADHNGFRANVKTTEPGTASEDPADVKMQANPVYVPPVANVVPIRAPPTVQSQQQAFDSYGGENDDDGWRRGPAAPQPPSKSTGWAHSRATGSGGATGGTYSTSTGFGGNAYGAPPVFATKGGSGSVAGTKGRGGRTHVTQYDSLPPPTAYVPPVIVNVAPLTGHKSVSVTSGKTTVLRRPGQRNFVPAVHSVHTRPLAPSHPPLVEQIQLHESVTRKAPTLQEHDLSFRQVYTPPREGRTSFRTQGTLGVTSSGPITTTATSSQPDDEVTISTTPAQPHDGNVLDHGPLVETFTVTPQRANKISAPIRYGARLRPPPPEDFSTNSPPREVTTVVSNELDERPTYDPHYELNREARDHGERRRAQLNSQYDTRDPQRQQRDHDHEHGDLSDHNPPEVLDWRVAKSGLSRGESPPRQVTHDGRGGHVATYDDREWHPIKAVPSRSRRHHNHFETIGTQSTDQLTDNRDRYGYTVYSNADPVSPVVVEKIVDLPRSTVYYTDETPTTPSTTTTAATTNSPSTSTAGVDNKKTTIPTTTSSAFREVATDSIPTSAASSPASSNGEPKPWVRQFYAGESVYGYGVPTLRDHMNEFLHLDYEGEGDHDGETGSQGAATAGPTTTTTAGTTPAPPATVTSRSQSVSFGARVNPSQGQPGEPKATEWIQRHGSGTGGGTSTHWKKR